LFEKLHEVIGDYFDIRELTPLTLNKLINRIEIGSEVVMEGQHRWEIRIIQWDL